MPRWTPLLALALTTPAHAIRFQIYDLGVIGTRSSAKSVNDAGMVVGTLSSARCFVWTEQLGMFKPGPYFNGFVVNNFTMYKVNNLGQAVCAIPWYIGGVLRNSVPAIWTLDRGFRTIRLPGDQGETDALSISDTGFVCGIWNHVKQEGFVWSEATGFRTVGSLDPSKGSAVVDVDSFGNAVGTSLNTAGRPRAVLYTFGQGLTDLGTLPWTEDSRATCLNDSGLILGYCESWAWGTYKPFWKRPGYPMEEFPQGPEGLLTYANDVNQKGQIVGDGGTVGDETAVFYEPGMGVLKVKNYVEGSFQGLELLEANGINEHGDIVGVALKDGRSRAFMAKRLD